MCFLVYLEDPHQQPRCVSVVRYICSTTVFSFWLLHVFPWAKLSWLAKDVEVLFDLARFGCISFGISYGELELLDSAPVQGEQPDSTQWPCSASLVTMVLMTSAALFFLKSLCGYFWLRGTPTDSVEPLTAYPVGDTYRFWPSENGLAKNSSRVAEYAHRTPRHLYFHWSKTCS